MRRHETLPEVGRPGRALSLVTALVTGAVLVSRGHKSAALLVAGCLVCWAVRDRASFWQAVSDGAFGLYVLGEVLWHAWSKLGAVAVSLALLHVLMSEDLERLATPAVLAHFEPVAWGTWAYLYIALVIRSVLDGLATILGLTGEIRVASFGETLRMAAKVGVHATSHLAVFSALAMLSTGEDHQFEPSLVLSFVTLVSLVALFPRTSLKTLFRTARFYTVMAAQLGVIFLGTTFALGVLFSLYLTIEGDWATGEKMFFYLSTLSALAYGLIAAAYGTLYLLVKAITWFLAWLTTERKPWVPTRTVHVFPSEPPRF